MGHEFQIRRATVEELPALTELWRVMRFEPADLVPRLTDFQVAMGPDGQLLGALAVEISGRQARLHSEAFTDFALADDLRKAFWARAQALAANHGAVRVWTQEHAPFWRQLGLAAPEAGKLEKLPEPWAKLPGNWFTMQLRDEEAIEHALDKEFARFIAMEKSGRDPMRPVKMLNTIATWLAILLAFLVIGGALYVLIHRGQLPEIGR
jgi:N-acetylglutamate synthase-like GNAT family acetyltransferase